MNRRILVSSIACILAACAGHNSGLAPGLPIHTDVVQRGKPPLHWVRFAPNDAGTYHTGMVAGPDGALWFTDSQRGLFRVDMHGRTTLYPLHYSPAYITVGADGKFYMDEEAGLTVAAFQPPNDLKVYQLHDETQVSGLGLGPDGNVWFTALEHLIRITPGGKITYFKYPSGGGSNIFSGIATGPDGDVWFTELYPHLVAKIDPNTLRITEYPLACQPEGIAAGGDGNMYVGCPGGLMRVTTLGHSTPLNYAPGAFTSPGSFIEGPQGDIYFGTFVDEPILGHLDVASGKVESITIPFHGDGIASQAAGPDGNVWDVDGQGYVNVYIRNVLRVAPANVVLSPGGQATLKVTYSGSSLLQAFSHNGAVAAIAPGFSPDTYVLTGIAKGKTTVTIFDGIGNSFNADVTVKGS